MLYRFAEKRPRWYGRAIDWAQFDRDGEFPYVKNCICYARLTTHGAVLFDSDECAIGPSDGYDTLGCEDPRIVTFEGAHYVFFCAFDGKMPRVAIARTADFGHYEQLGVIDHTYADKDAFIFPERIHGRIAYMHRIAPNIQIDYFDSFEEMLAPSSWAHYDARLEQQTVLRPEYAFEWKKVGGGVPPIKTGYGWLVIYHGVDRLGIYHTGAALLDLDNPSMIVARLPYSVLSPKAEFETQGDYRGCVFAQGSFVNDGDLYISYGTADKFTALARTNLEQLLEELQVHAT